MALRSAQFAVNDETKAEGGHETSAGERKHAYSFYSTFYGASGSAELVC